MTKALQSKNIYFQKFKKHLLPYSEFKGFKRVPRTVTLEFVAINYLTIRGGSRKKIAKKMIPKVPTNKKV